MSKVSTGITINTSKCYERAQQCNDILSLVLLCDSFSLIVILFNLQCQLYI